MGIPAAVRQDSLHAVQRLFSTFPAGAPGAGLLMLRLLLGGTLATQGALREDAVGVFEAACGALLVAGFATPVAALAGAILGLAAGLHGWPAVYVSVVALAVALLGPGAFSLDARRFGRRELVVPRRRVE